MKKMLFALVAVMSSLSAFAADVIITTKSEKLEVKIEEVSETEIRYKKMNNLKGPTFVLSTKEINSILFENGDVQVIDHTAQTQPQPQSQPQPAMQATGLVYTMQPAYADPYGSYADQSITGSLLTTTGGSGYVLNGRRYTERELVNMYAEMCPAAYNQYKSGSKMFASGIGLGLMGLLVGVGVGVPLYVCSYTTYDVYSSRYGTYEVTEVNGPMWAAGVSMMVIGGVSMGVSVPLWATGSMRMKQAHQIYNTQCGQQAKVPVSLDLTRSQNGIGLALRF